jgi:predicted nucleic acid-binding protein
MQRLARSDELITTEPVVMELLAGARTDQRAEAIRRVLARHLVAPVGGIETFESAAAVYRSCRSGGETVRRMTDCLIAAVASRVGATLLHNDRDFDVIARHTDLRVISADRSRDR